MGNLIFKDPNLVDEISRLARKKKVAKDEVLMSPGQDIVFVPIVSEGVLRIVREDDEGHEVFLYHLYPGQTCAMAINCCQAGRKSMVKAIAEEDTEVILVPVDAVDRWLRFPEWKMFVNTTYSTRFEELMQVIDLIAFSNMDKQVMHYLNERSKALHTKALYITHQQIADEMHTHREAISRILRALEKKNLLKLGRNTIEIL